MLTEGASRLSVRPVLAVLLLLPLLPVAPGSLADSPFPQDDAGSGADAPNLFEEALPLNGLTSFEGRLFTSPEGDITQPLIGPVFDREDWYSFDVKKGQRVSVLSWGLEDENSWPIVYLWTPAGHRGICACPSLIADSSGTWRIQALTQSTGGLYHIEYAVSDTTGLVGAFADTAATVLGFELGPGGAVIGKHLVTTFDTQGQGDANAVVDFKEDLSAGSGAWSSGGAFTLGAHAHVGDVSVTTPWVRRFSDFGHAFSWSTEGWIFSNPGRWYIASITTGRASYVWFELELRGNATYLGHSKVPMDQGVRLHQYDFQGGAAVMVPLAAYASVGVSATVPIRNFMLGLYTCGSGEIGIGCRVEYPSGGGFSVEHGGFVLGAKRGDWRLSSDAEIQALGQEKLQFVGADVKLPDVGHPHKPDKPDHPGRHHS